MVDKIERKVYDYLGDMRIAIEGQVSKLNRYELNIEEKPFLGEFDALIKVEEGPITEIKIDKRHPYLWVKPNLERLPISGVDYYRYGSKVRSHWENSSFEHTIKDYLLDDEGGLEAFRHIYCTSPLSIRKALVHGTSLKIGEKGFLIVGPCRSGKTTLSLSLLDKFRGQLIGEGISLISLEEERLQAHYLPRQVYARFSSISQMERLFPLLDNYNLSEATQHLDHEAIRKIIVAKAFHVDAGISITRQKFAELMKIKLMRSFQISNIIFPIYSAGDSLHISSLNIIEALNLLKENEFPKNSTFLRIRSQRDIQPPLDSIISSDWLKGISCRKIHFDGHRNLSSSLLEELIK